VKLFPWETIDAPGAILGTGAAGINNRGQIVGAAEVDRAGPLATPGGGGGDSVDGPHALPFGLSRPRLDLH
jgi:hypothetical protein